MSAANSPEAAVSFSTRARPRTTPPRSIRALTFSSAQPSRESFPASNLLCLGAFGRSRRLRLLLAAQEIVDRDPQRLEPGGVERLRAGLRIGKEPRPIFL